MSRCEAVVGRRAYSRPGRCEKIRNVKRVEVREGGDRVRLLLCSIHRRLAAAKRPLERAR